VTDGDRQDAAARRAAAAGLRVSQLQARRDALASGLPVTVDSVQEARQHAELALTHAARAHHSAGRRHLDAEQAHRRAAAAHEEAALRARDTDVDGHQEAAERHRDAANHHHDAAGVQFECEETDTNAITRPPPSAAVPR
jgi:hypothetical protein